MKLFALMMLAYLYVKSSSQRPTPSMDTGGRACGGVTGKTWQCDTRDLSFTCT